MEHIRLLPDQFLRAFLRIRNSRLRISLQQIFTIGHVGRPDCVVNGGPVGVEYDEPQQGRPAGVRQHIQQHLVDRILVDDDASRRGQRDCGDAEQNVHDMHVDAGAEDDDAEPTPKTCAVDWVSLVELALLRSRRGKRSRLATQKSGQKEGPDDRNSVVWLPGLTKFHALPGSTRAGQQGFTYMVPSTWWRLHRAAQFDSQREGS